MTVKISHPGLKEWIRRSARLCRPARIVVLNGSPAEKKRLEREAVRSGELIGLNPKKLPGCFYHRSRPNDVARVEHLTFICTTKKGDAGPTNNWMKPARAIRRAERLFRNAMKGRTMYVIPFTMGKPGSPFAKVGVQLTDSIYVAMSMGIMTHMGAAALKRLGKKGDFTKCLHSTADCNPKRRLILHFPETDTIWSVGSGYGGNALLGKKCMALRIASAQAAKEGWMAEHMLVMGVENPNGKRTYIAAAFPSACGKTNLAMLVPPLPFRKKGWRVWTVGDDIAWMRIGKDGSLYAVNPEWGMFGVAPGTNSKTNPNAAAAIRKNTLFTNVLLKKDGTVWWEGGDGPIPTSGVDWKGRPWKPGTAERGAHPNSRFTAPLAQCPSFTKKYHDPRGVRISAILFGGRHDGLAPLVYEARDWRHGVYVGASMSSQRTAAQTGTVGEVRRDPMAMLPFCGINMASYFRHWLEMGEKIGRPPKIFHVNWFRKRKGKFLWPGFGENFRIVQWIVNRCRKLASAKGSPIGYLPKRKDVDLSGLKLSDRQWSDLFSIDSREWEADLERQEMFFKKFGKTMPKEIWENRKELKRRIALLSPRGAGNDCYPSPIN